MTEIERLRAENTRLRAAAKAYQDLCVCFRLGKPPSERLHKRLAAAKKVLLEEPSCGRTQG